MAFASDSTPIPAVGGPGLTRRDILSGSVLTIALVGAIVGAPVHRGAGPDLSAVAEGWLADARDLGMWVICGPDGNVWRCAPHDDGADRAEARERHWTKLHARPRLQRAVYAAVGRESALSV